MLWASWQVSYSYFERWLWCVYKCKLRRIIMYSRSPDQCRVLGNRKSCGPYSTCARWWYSPLWPGCFWKCIHLIRGFFKLVLGKRYYLLWWCNLRLTLWPVTECLLSYTGADGWWSLSLSRLEAFQCFLLWHQTSLTLVKMCRGGRMFAPTKTWRRWHRRINTPQKRYAICSALAASAIPALVMSKGNLKKYLIQVNTDKLNSLIYWNVTAN